MLRYLLTIACVLAPAVLARAADAQPAQEGLIAPQSIALPWTVGIGILVVTLIAGFKHPGRSHLD